VLGPLRRCWRALPTDPRSVAARCAVGFFQTAGHSVARWLRFYGCDWAAVTGAGGRVTKFGCRRRLCSSFCLSSTTAEDGGRVKD